MRHLIPPRSVRIIFLAVAVLALASCGSSGPALYPVTGKVLFQGQPAEGASVVFVPDGPAEIAALRPSGLVQADGTFTLSTYPHGEGAPAGEYRIVVTWYPPNTRAPEEDETGEIVQAKNQLPAHYGDAESSPLRATVQNGATNLEPFLLTK